jgi:hypothetical protein
MDANELWERAAYAQERSRAAETRRDMHAAKQWARLAAMYTRQAEKRAR